VGFLVEILLEMIFTIARMNPPTSGHQGLIRKMMEKALEMDLDRVYIILSGTLDGKNPLDCETKKELLVGNVSSVVENLKQKWIAEGGMDEGVIGKIRGCRVNVVCMNDASIDTGKYGTNPILKCINYIVDIFEKGEKSGKSILFVGEDRGNSYGWISSGWKLGVLEIIPLERPEGAISATFVRGLAMEGNQDGFLGEMEKIGISRSRGEEVYLEIRRKLGESLKKSKKTGKTTKRKPSVEKTEASPPPLETEMEPKPKKKLVVKKSLKTSSKSPENSESSEIPKTTRATRSKKGGRRLF
jgi:hypothetical protein